MAMTLPAVLLATLQTVNPVTFAAMTALLFIAHGTQKLFGWPANQPQPTAETFSQFWAAGVINGVKGGSTVPARTKTTKAPSRSASVNASITPAKQSAGDAAAMTCCVAAKATTFSPATRRTAAAGATALRDGLRGDKPDPQRLRARVEQRPVAGAAVETVGLRLHPVRAAKHLVALPPARHLPPPPRSRTSSGWRADGGEIFYQAPDRNLMVVPIEWGPAGPVPGVYSASSRATSPRRPASTRPCSGAAPRGSNRSSGARRPASRTRAARRAPGLDRAPGGAARSPPPCPATAGTLRRGARPRARRFRADLRRHRHTRTRGLRTTA